MNRRLFLAAPLAFAADTVIARAVKEHGIPSLALVTLSRGKVARRECIDCDPDTVFEAASLSKPVFATAVLRLARYGRFDLDKPLVDYLGGTYVHFQQPWRKDSPSDQVTEPRIHKLTARLILSHRSGLPNWRFRQPLTFIREPGEWGYSGEGYVLLQRAVERVTGQTMDEFTAPLGLARSRWVQEKAGMGLNHANAAGSLLTTLNDYTRFLQDTLHGRTPREMLEPVAVAVKEYSLQWGLGWGLVDHADQRWLFHWGSNPGYKAFVLGSLKTRDALLYFTNSDNGLKPLRTILRETLGIEPPLLEWKMLQ